MTATFSSPEARAFFCGLPLRELRRRQDLCQQQQRIAYDQKLRADTHAALATMESDLTLAVGVVAGLWTVA